MKQLYASLIFSIEPCITIIHYLRSQQCSYREIQSVWFDENNLRIFESILMKKKNETETIKTVDSKQR